MISEVYCTYIDPKECDPKEVGKFYFLHNLIGCDDIIDSLYLAHETKQMMIRNKLISNAIKSGDISRHPNVNDAIFGLSTLHDTAILVVEY